MSESSENEQFAMRMIHEHLARFVECHGHPPPGMCLSRRFYRALFAELTSGMKGQWKCLETGEVSEDPPEDAIEEGRIAGVPFVVDPTLKGLVVVSREVEL